MQSISKNCGYCSTLSLYSWYIISIMYFYSPSDLLQNCFSVSNSGSFSSHLDTLGSVNDNQSTRGVPVTNQSQSSSRYCSNTNIQMRNNLSSQFHESQSSNLSNGSGETNPATEHLLRRHQNASKDNLTNCGGSSVVPADHRARSRSRSRCILLKMLLLLSSLV